MIAFHHSLFHWKAWPNKPDQYFKYAGGFVGKPGQIYQVRFNLEATCIVQDLKTEHITEIFLGAPCRTEYTIANRNLFQIPSDERRMAFSRTMSIPISRRPSNEESPYRSKRLKEQFCSHDIDLRHYQSEQVLTNTQEIVDATLNHHLINARVSYLDPAQDLKVILEFPVNLININDEDPEFQICTGPIVLPDLKTWDGLEIHQCFVADAAISDFNYTEFILRREIEIAEREKSWYEMPRGRDRLSLNDPMKLPPNGLPRKPKPLVYNEIWEWKSENVILKTSNSI